VGVRQHLIAAWGIGGVCLLLVQALLRLTPIAIEPIADGMTGAQWGIWVVWVAANGYMEGYRGFQTRFSPRVVQRAFFLAKNPRPLHVVLAPVFCMSYFHAARRGKIVAWALLVFIVCAVIAIRFMPQPWRGIVDAGVVIGLAWGLVAIVVFWARALVQPPEAPNDLPRNS
jgi:hypothetical protein